MKANEAPEKIWVDPASDLPKLSGHIDKNSVEYIRKDAFIEKAAKYLYEYNQNMVKKYGVKTVLSCSEFTINVEDFKKAMKL